MYPHYTVDLETMGNGPTSAIVAIGAVAFNPETEEKSLPFYQVVSLESSLKEGLTVDAGTIQWWMSQEDEAREALFAEPMHPLPVALSLYSQWVDMHCGNKAACWTHATFDAPILGYAYRQLGVAQPTHFRKQRDIRTLTDLHIQKFGRKVVTQRVGTHHNAADDASYQADYIMTMLREMYGTE